MTTQPSRPIRWTRRAELFANIFWTVCILAGCWLIPGLLNSLIR